MGGVWLGEIYNQKEQADAVFDMNQPTLEFMGAIAFGYPAEKGESERLPLDSFVQWK